MKAEPRQRLLDTAATLFYERGIPNVGINELVDQAGVARMTLYHHFASKDELVTATLARCGDAGHAMNDRAARHPLLVACALSLGPSIGNGFGRFAYALILPAMKADLAWTYTQAGWINTANAIGYLVGALLSLRLIARVGS